MPSKLKSQTARANGAKSRGPVTPQGRARSSGNSLRHGFSAQSVVLPTESLEDFQSLLASYLDQFDPQGGVEMELVQAMAATRWRLRRLCTIETNLLNTEMACHANAIEREIKSIDDDGRMAWVFKRLADNSNSLSLLIRYEGTLNRSYDRALKQLLLLQSGRHRPQPNEPKPQPGSNPVTPRIVSPIPAPSVPGTDSDGPSSDAQGTPGNADPGPDPTPNSPPASPPC